MRNKTSFFNYFAVLICLPIFSYIMVYTFLNYQSLLSNFIQSSYYILLATTVLFLSIIVKKIINERKSVVVFFKSSGLGLIFCFLVTTLVFISVNSKHRILADETNVLSVSKSMLFEKRVDNIMEGYWYYGKLHSETSEIDKRPLLFPFFVSIIHSLFGFSYKNLFIANFMVLFLLLSTLSVVLKNRLGVLWGFAGVLLTLSQPIVTLTATSGQIDLIHTLFFFFAFLCFFHFVKKPSGENFSLLWITLVMFCNTRYEALPIAVLIVLAALLFVKNRNEIFKKNRLIYAATPLMLMPFIWQRILTLYSSEQAGTNGFIFGAFKWEYFVKANSNFFQDLFKIDFDVPLAEIVNILGLLGIIYFLVLLVTKKIKLDRPTKWFVGTLGLALLFQWGVVHSYFSTHLDRYLLTGRFYLIFCVIFSIAATWLMSHVPLIRRRPWIALIAAFCCILIYHPISVGRNISSTLEVIRQFDYEMNFVQKQPDKNFLIICDRPGMFTAYQYGAIYFETARRDSKKVLERFRNHLYRDIYIFQQITYKDSTPEKGQELSDDYQLETLDELQNTQDYFFRISKVVKP
jgi:hypothetical protein